MGGYVRNQKNSISALASSLVQSLKSSPPPSPPVTITSRSHNMPTTKFVQKPNAPPPPLLKPQPPLPPRSVPPPPPPNAPPPALLPISTISNNLATAASVNTKEKKEYTDKELLESLGLSSETQNLLSTLKDIPKSIFKNKPKYDCTQQCIHLRHNF